MALEFRSVTKEFATNSGKPLTAVHDVSFRVNEGEFVSVVGPSGCGKSTILSMTAGLYQPTRGEVRVSEELVTGPNSHVGFMLQKDLLLPWRSILPTSSSVSKRAVWARPPGANALWPS
jgi:NitT/TauT family transport system ATP-binding protein